MKYFKFLILIVIGLLFVSSCNKKHECKPLEQFESDNIYHWNKCFDSKCEETFNKVAHIFNNNICTVCGKHVEQNNVGELENATKGMTYILSNDKTYYILESVGDAKQQSEIVIPSKYNGLPVTSIVNYAFYNCTSLTSIEIPASLTSIGESAFSGCSGLINVYYQGTIEEWCDIDFASSSANPMYFAKYFYMKDSNNEYYEIKEMLIPNTLTEIGNYQFYGFENITNIVVPNSVTSIGESAFKDCSSLTSITLPFIGASLKTTKNIHFGYIFGANSSLNNIMNVPTSLKEVIITGGTSIGNQAFSSCSSLISIKIPGSITSIGESAFKDCSSLTNIEIPASVTSIGYYVFSGCNSLTSIVVDQKNPKYDSRNNCNAIIESSTNTLIVGCQNTTISNDVTSIGNWAFFSCSSLTSIVIPNSVTSIGGYAFSSCSSLTSIKISNNITSIEEYAFNNCNSLEYNIYDSVKYLGNDNNPYLVLIESINYDITSCAINEYTKIIMNFAFSNRSNLTSIEIPDSITSIGEYAFNNCSSLTSIEIPISVTSIGDSAFNNCSSLTSIVIPKSVTNIGDRAFSSCSSLTSIEIPDSITSIGSNTFSYCSSLTSIEIPKSVTSIGDRAFSSCSSLTSIEIPDSITSIGSDAFKDCSSLTSIEIPNSVTSIGDRAFTGCRSLTSIEIPNSVISVGSNAFSSCSRLEYNTYDNAKYLGNDNNPYLVLIESINDNITNCKININTKIIAGGAFYGCKSLTSIEIPDSITSIGSDAFHNCSNLTSIEIPISVTRIGSWAFFDCSSLTIYCKASSEPSGWDNFWNFSDCPVVWGYKEE